MRKLFATLCAVSVLGAGVASTAGAQIQDGLVNVAIGDVEILNDARIGVAANVAANICGVKVGPLAILGMAVDRGGPMQTVCTVDQAPVTISQNN